jgi:hypothetical protein
MYCFIYTVVPLPESIPVDTGRITTTICKQNRLLVDVGRDSVFPWFDDLVSCNHHLESQQLFGIVRSYICHSTWLMHIIPIRKRVAGENKRFADQFGVAIDLSNKSNMWSSC